MSYPCCGDVLIIENEKYYRCLWDSTLIKLTSGLHPEGKECPNCRRTIRTSFQETECETRTVKQYKCNNEDWWTIVEVSDG